MKKIILLSLCLITGFLNSLAQSPIYPFKPKEKKIIVFHTISHCDWAPDLPEALPSMQSARPYINGLVFHVGRDYESADFAFNNEVWTEASLKFNDLRSISTKWTTLTDNFILVWGHSRNVNPDFYNDNLWAQITRNAELTGRAVMTAGCKGIMFDPEFYSAGETYSPWWFSKSNVRGAPPYSGKSFTEVKAKARQRGREYARALQRYMPKITILTTFLYGSSWDYCYGSINNQPASEYALLPAFADGMLEALNSESTIIDGNGTAYYINSSREYVENSAASYTHVRLEATPAVCDPMLLSKWNAQGQVAMAPYLDFCYNLYDDQPYSTPLYQSRWMKHNVYNSLLTTDQYVWVYIEQMNFWNGENSPVGVNVAADVSEAVAKFRNAEPLGFDMYSLGEQAQFITSPRITMTSPANDMVINAAGPITLSTTIDPSNSVSRVVFYANSLRIGEATSPPYSITRNFLRADYTLFARQFNTNGTHTTSAPVNIFANNIVTKTTKGNVNRLVIYPNPAKTKVFIPENISKIQSCDITSLDGRLVQTGTVQGGAILVESLKPGVYIIKLKTAAGESMQRFVKE
ncbi:T9SS type A sorting domain-containing protein [Hymenobacter sp. BT664]|uniref:T9SS type A sorting domain-containing protein n=1 Tax=Hymenobacter montanus TaxID=2771359 RepID=A0A927BFU8_9BACT|nr:Ig-like domain-containing protein [Hymenobacter montanus]MBD2770105.1 T9SS type A sorting domain-containing protein [Hymenobacter montanus]